MTTTHAPAYKQLFCHPQMVVDLLRGYVHEAWVAQLDFSTLERVPDSFVSDDLREREDDIIWRVRWGERWLYLYLIIEFQSTVDKFMAVRLLTYVGLLWQSLAYPKKAKDPDHKPQPPIERLPPVLPIVLYNGEGRWSAATELSALLEEGLPESLARFQPQLRYLLLDEGLFANHPLPTVRNLVAALFKLENSRTPEDIAAVLRRLIDWLGDPAQDPLRRSFTVWLNRILLPRRLPGVVLTENYELQEMHTMLAERVKSWTDEWEKRGEKRGERRGEKRGVRRGVRKGEGLLLRALLQHRFGPQLPEWVDQRLKDAATADLERWGKAILDARTLEQVFGDGSPSD